jgi:hypothetical protein
LAFVRSSLILANNFLPLSAALCGSKELALKITLGCGIELVSFGATENEVKSLLGEPDKVYFTDSDCKRLQYNDLLIELSLEPDNENRLGWLEIHNPDAELFGSRLIGKSFAEIEAFLKSKLEGTPTIDDYGSSISVNYDDQWLELQFEFDRLTNINFGVLYSDNDIVLWPTT